MANPNVIESPHFSKPYGSFSKSYTYLTSHFVANKHGVREPDAEYGDDLTTKLTALLKLPDWPQLPDGAYLNAQQATRLYRSAHAIQALTHILDRSTHLQGLAQDYNEPNPTLTEYQQSQLWAGLIELGRELVGVMDEVQELSQENS